MKATVGRRVALVTRARPGREDTGVMNARRVDLRAAAAAVLAWVMLGAYLALVDEQAGDAAAWYVALLVLGAVAAGYGAVTSLPAHRLALVVAGLLLGVGGVLVLAAVGLPVLVAGVLCLVAAVRPFRGDPEGG